MRRERINILFGSLVGFASVVLIQLLTLDIKALDQPLKIAIGCFSIVLPASAFYVLSAQVHLSNKGITEVPGLYLAMAVLTAVFGLFAIGALFWHFGLMSLVIFFVTAFVALFSFNKLDANKRSYFSLKKDNPQKRNRKKNPVL